MNKDLLKIFNIILQLKGIKKVPYILDSEDMLVIYNYWKIYGLNKYMTIKKFRKVVVEYSVFTGKTLHSACEELCKKIKF